MSRPKSGAASDGLLTRHADPGGHSTALVVVSLLSVYLAWGSTYLAIRIALTSLPPLLLAGVRGVVAGVLLLAWAWWRGQPFGSRTSLRNAVVIGLLLVSGGNGLVTVAEQWVSSGLAATIASSGTIWLVLMLAVAGERPTRGEAAGIALGFAGVVLLNLDGELRASPAGALALLGATLSWSVGSLLTRRLALPKHGAVIVGVELLAGGAALTAIGLVLGERVAISALTREAVVAWWYLVIAGSLVGFTSFTYLMRNVRPALATSFVYVNPIVAVALGVMLGGEHVGPLAAVGVVVSVVGLAAVTLASRPRTRR